MSSSTDNRQPATGNPAPSTATKNKPHIAVIGAGLSGLNAARLLVAQGFAVTILEAADRVGGRVYDLKDEGSFEPMGPEFIHGTLPRTMGLLKHYGIKAIEEEGDFITARGGDLLEEGEEEDRRDDRRLQEAMKALTDDMPLEAFLRDFLARNPGMEQAAEMARSYARGYFAADPANFSTLALREDWMDEHPEGTPQIDYWTQYRPEGGYSALVEAMVEELGDRVDIQLSSPVTAIRWQEGQAEVVYKGLFGADKSLACQAVVLAVPVGTLRRAEGVGSIGFAPELPEKRKAAQDIGSGPVLKVRLDFDRRFWEDDEALKNAGFLLAPGQPIAAFWTDLPRKTPTLTAWAGGKAARPFSGTDEEQVLNACLDSLAHAMARPVEDLWDMLASFTVSYWGNDPFIPEAYSYDKAGCQHAAAQLAEPVANTLFFAGEGTVRARHGGTCEAALEAGERAALQVSQAMARTGKSKP